MLYTFAGYPLLLWLFARVKPKPVAKKSDSDLPFVTVLLIVRNEAGLIHDRLNNLFSCDYPPEKLELVVVSDGSTDDTVKKIRSFDSAQMIFIELPERKGKAYCINLARTRACGKILVFADARQTFERNALSVLVSNFFEPTVGAVSGKLLVSRAARGIGKTIGSYWEYEKTVRFLESRSGSSMGCTGAIYAARAELVKDIPDDTLLDDLVIPLHIVASGYRVVFDPYATAFDPQSQDPDREELRKKRTLAGNFQVLFRYPQWMLPWKYRCCWRLVSHKYLRLATPLFCTGAFAASALLDGVFFTLCFYCQWLFYMFAMIGMVFPKLQFKMFAAPAAFVFMNLMIIKGLFYYIKGGYKEGWK